MKKIYLPLVTLFLSNLLLAQGGHIQNGNFENWTNNVLYESPTDWQSTNSEFAGLLEAVTKSTDAVDGTYSVKLENQLIDGDSIFGYVVLGNNGIDEGIPYANAVDSISGWWKYETMPGDSITVLVLQFVMGNQIPTMHKVAGTQSSWTRFSFPLNFPYQDSIVVAFASGDAMNDFSIPGSWLMLDDITIIDGNSPTPDLPNHSFDNWTATSVEDADYWHSINPYTVYSNQYTVYKTTDAYEGTYAMSIETKEIWGDTVQGIVSNGELESIWNGNAGAFYYGSPSGMRGQYKFTEGTDGSEAQVTAIFYAQGNLVGYASLTPSPTNTYQSFDLPIVLASAPDSLTIYMQSGIGLGSLLTIDAFDFYGNNIGIHENQPILTQANAYPNPALEIINVSFDLPVSSEVEIVVYNLNGSQLHRQKIGQLAAGKHQFPVDLNALAPGNYLLQVESSIGRVAMPVQKF